MDEWEYWLKNDPDRDFILHGLKNGFSLIDSSPQDVPVATTPNHPSALDPRFKTKVDARIMEEVQDGNYQVLPGPPTIVSALAVVPKPDGDIRLIHDLSRPYGHSLNDFASKDECSYVTLEQALQGCEPGYWLAKVDLKWAYRAVPIRPDQYPLTGLQWTFTNATSPMFFSDCRLPFGARKSPAIFNRITKSIQRMLCRLGIRVSAYLDDFLIVAPTKEQCQGSLTSLINLLRRLGFRINWNKVSDPCQCLTFLGIEINTKAETLRLDPKKAQDLTVNLQQTLSKKRLSKRQLQALGGRLNWASTVHPWGRAYTASIYRAVSLLKSPHHKLLLNKDIIADIQWWLACLNKLPNVRLIWDNRPNISIVTDSCAAAGGAFCQGDWMYVNWLLDKPRIANQHINIKELAMAVESVARFAPAHPSCHLRIMTNNFMTSCAINNKTSSNPMAVSLLKELHHSVQSFNITVTGHYIKGSSNDLADAISRLHSPGQSQRFASLLAALYHHQPLVYHIANHMSCKSYQFLLPMFQKLWTLWYSWISRSPNSAHKPWPLTLRKPIQRTSTPTWHSAHSMTYQPSLPPQPMYAGTLPILAEVNPPHPYNSTSQ